MFSLPLRPLPRVHNGVDEVTTGDASRAHGAPAVTATLLAVGTVDRARTTHCSSMAFDVLAVDD